MWGLIIVLFLILFSNTADAAPLISSAVGVFKHHSSVTVSGSGFGTKSAVAPLLWDTVDNQASYSGLNNGDVIPVGGGYPWTINSESQNTARFLSNRQRGKSTASYTNSVTYSSDLGVHIKASLGGENFPTAADSQLYITWWHRAGGDWQNAAQSCKILRASESGQFGTYQMSWTQTQLLLYDDTIARQRLSVFPSYPGTYTDWHRNEVLFDNTETPYYPRVIASVDGVERVNKVSGESGFCGSTPSNCTVGSWGPATGIYAVGYDPNIDGTGANPSFDFDDIYVDDTRSRVEICTGSTWAAKGACEVQIPHTSWGDTTLQITVNQGAFADSSTAYLYVVDADGVANTNGEEITFGVGESDTTAPTITAFVIPATTSSLTVPITTFTATDAVGVTGYCVTETNDSGTCSWSGSAPVQHVFGTAGAKTLYAFAKDFAGNISTSASDGVTITTAMPHAVKVGGKCLKVGGKLFKVE